MKELILYAGILVLVVFAVLVLIRLLFKKMHIVLSAVLGVLGLIAVNASAEITGITLGYSVLSVAVSGLLGLPGVAFLLIEKLI